MRTIPDTTSPARRRQARAARARRLQMRTGATRLLVHLSGKHTYAQLLSPEAKVLASASSAEKEMRGKLANGGNIAAAAAIGARLAEKAAAQGAAGKIAFDRGGRKYAGRVRAFAEAARAAGMQF